MPSESKSLKMARQYVARGWSVIPIRRDTKVPAVQWKEFQSRRPTDDELVHWFDKDLHNVAVVTGSVSGVSVIDIDTHKGGDVNAIWSACETGLVVSTPRGGAHLYYVNPAGGLPNRAGVLEGVDVRGEGGYVLAPPSTNSAGTEYAWSLYDTASPLPGAWLDDLRGSSKSKDKDDTPGWVGQLLEGLSEGGRNDACARLAGYFIGKGLPKDVVVATLEGWNERNGPPLSYKEIVTTVDSVWRKEKTAYRTGTSNTEEGGTFNTLTLDDFMRKYAQQEMQWTVPDWLPRSTIAMIVAAPESFKTWITFDLAVSIACGGKFLGTYQVERPGPVLLVQQEDFTGATAQRLGLIISERTRPAPDGIFLPPSLPIHLHVERQLRFDNKEVLDAFVGAIERIRPELVVIDPMYSVAVENDDYLSKTVQHMRVLKQLRDEYGCSFLLVHHTRKGATDGTKREDGWGSQFLNAFLETGLQVRRVEDADNTVTLRRHFKAAAGKEERRLAFTIDTESFPNVYKIREMADDDEQAKADKVLHEISTNGHLTVDQLQELTGFIGKTLRAALKSLQDGGFVVYDKKLQAYKEK